MGSFCISIYMRGNFALNRPPFLYKSFGKSECTLKYHLLFSNSLVIKTRLTVHRQQTQFHRMIMNSCIFFNHFSKLSAFEKLQDYGSFGAWVLLYMEHRAVVQISLLRFNSLKLKKKKILNVQPMHSLIWFTETSKKTLLLI